MCWGLEATYFDHGEIVDKYCKLVEDWPQFCYVINLLPKKAHENIYEELDKSVYYNTSSRT